MTKLEKIKKEFLNWGLHEYCDLIRIINSVSAEFEPENKEDKKNKVLQTVRYLLESGLYVVQESKVNEISFDPFDTIDEIISKIESLYKYSNTGDGDAWKWIIALKLSPKGIVAARKDLLSTIKSEEEIVLACYKKQPNLNDMIKIISHAFDTNDIDEIASETLENLDFLIGSKYIEPIDTEYWKNNWQHSRYKERIDLEEKIKKIISYPNEGQNILFTSTPVTNALVEKWKECGGRLVNDWYYYMDNIDAT